jgi:hypothetical protein
MAGQVFCVCSFVAYDWRVRSREPRIELSLTYSLDYEEYTTHKMINCSVEMFINKPYRLVKTLMPVCSNV